MLFAKGHVTTGRPLHVFRRGRALPLNLPHHQLAPHPMLAQFGRIWRDDGRIAVNARQLSPNAGLKQVPPLGAAAAWLRH